MRSQLVMHINRANSIADGKIKVSHGGFRAGSGRPKGAKDRSPRRRFVAEQNELILAGIVPEDIAKLSAYEILHACMCRFYQQGELREAASAAAQLLPYQLPKLSAVDVTQTIQERQVETLTRDELLSVIHEEREADQAEKQAELMGMIAADKAAMQAEAPRVN